MTDQWPQAWTRAAIEMCVLALVKESGLTHGYEIAQRLRGAGLGDLKGGTLYPILGRLEDRGHLSSYWASGVSGPGRKLVEITDEGVRVLEASAADWVRWTRQVAATIGITHSTPGGP